MDNKRVNGSSAAMPFTHKPEYQYQEAGLTKREHFAGLAMQALIANPELRGAHEDCAKAAISYTDALLKELEK